MVSVPLRRTSRRDEPRTDGGVCAMSDSGSSKSNSETFTALIVAAGCGRLRKSGLESVEARCGHRHRLPPLFPQDRPQNLIVIPAVAHECAPQHAFLKST